ncbi:MAG: DUF4440 domain-containing protein [Pseudomonadales bacterium]|nr:DUF4440 domain-containing protein [Pseudomonadales bacterium]MBO6564777.1 DUF4440 domain-containing protein [Pseudomonadales bacterium]MBO6595886.1 DUF4440 domain-containing protein [Pseudomonadales bacterium]MBO6656751.1 DUF4440 domain-containing protein [Pseudomonadales bacterium]MBO6702491.1 DUF4440 domain-containing protein [Pseudomonadales bacterium]
MKILWALALLVGAPSIAADGSEEKAAIEQVYANWREAVETADIPGYVSVLASDVKLMPPDADAIVGKAGYGAFLVPVFAAATYDIDVIGDFEIDVFGDTAVAEYEYIIELSMKEGAEITEPGAITAARSHNRYFDVLRKNRAGEWEIWRHLWRTL